MTLDDPLTIRVSYLSKCFGSWEDLMTDTPENMLLLLPRLTPDVRLRVVAVNRPGVGVLTGTRDEVIAAVEALTE